MAIYGFINIIAAATHTLFVLKIIPFACYTLHSLATKLLYPSRSKINVSSWNEFIGQVHITFFKSTIICKQRKIQLQLPFVVAQPSSRAPPFPPSLKSLVSHKSHTERGKTSLDYAYVHCLHIYTFIYKRE